ncbi:MAG: hypothetical protein JJLCMIEE_00251 [Acidimicrobiales bacterium]|nr:MAG: lysine 2,3-aminomutase [Actinomycetota bacterium]MBV6507210.1 hypothetical protein [Acidimicrobiales bacterium]RIK05504.1 MAG: lysine 2,3-aminomutase [Acidobacteriota bacterium]
MIQAENEAPVLRTFQLRNLDSMPNIDRLSDEQRFAIEVVGRVLPFKTNSYIAEQLIDWDAVPDDPMFRLTFPQQGMLHEEDFSVLAGLLKGSASADAIDDAVRRVQRSLNPHPSGQVSLNTPWLNGLPLPGMQHKYRETVLFFPSQGQTCHAYCSYCFRWPQFVNLDDLRFASKESHAVLDYLRQHPHVTDVLITGGDPLIMRTGVLRRYIEPLLAPEFEHVNIRLGTKAPAYWPYRFTTDSDADDLLRLFEEVIGARRHLALMAHYSHPRELSTAAAERALERITATGAVVRCQSPLIRQVNDSANTWAELVRRQVRAGAIPYYMFVERDTGARDFFSVPLARALEVFNGAHARVSGLSRTLRGPVMSALPGKIMVDGVAHVANEKVFVLKMLQGRNPDWVNRVFFARFDPAATWYDDLSPAFGAREFFFEPEMSAAPETGSFIDHVLGNGAQHGNGGRLDETADVEVTVLPRQPEHVDSA